MHTLGSSQRAMQCLDNQASIISAISASSINFMMVCAPFRVIMYEGVPAQLHRLSNLYKYTSRSLSNRSFPVSPDHKPVASDLNRLSSWPVDDSSGFIHTKSAPSGSCASSAL